MINIEKRKTFKLECATYSSESIIVFFDTRCLLENIETKNNNLNNLILNDVDKELLSKLYLFSYFLEQSALLNEPHHLANYLYEISNLFNQFYESEKILEINDSEHLSSKLYITNLFLTTSQNVMLCLGITPVNKM